MNRFPTIAEHHSYPNRDENLEKIDSLVLLIRDTYFKKHHIDNKSSTLHNTACTDFSSFHISFPLSCGSSVLNDLLNELKSCPLLTLFCNYKTSSIGIRVLNIHSNIHQLNNSIDKFPEFIENYNKSTDSINKFNL